MRRLAIMPLTMSLMLLSACGGTENRGLETVHQPVVTRTNYTYDVLGQMSAADIRSIDGWFEALKVGYGDRIAIDDPTGSMSGRDEIAALAARRGMLIDDTAPITQGPIADGMARIVISRSKATVPGCPDWSRKSQPNFDNHAMSNYGCAINANLAAMIANPEDLLAGQVGDTSPDAEISGKAIKVFRDAPPTGQQGLKEQNTKGAK